MEAKHKRIYRARRERADALFCAWTQLEYARRLRIEGNQPDADYLLKLVAQSRRIAALAKAGA